jgi:hypothetical protein
LLKIAKHLLISQIATQNNFAMHFSCEPVAGVDALAGGFQVGGLQISEAKPVVQSLWTGVNAHPDCFREIFVRPV